GAGTHGAAAAPASAPLPVGARHAGAGLAPGATPGSSTPPAKGTYELILTDDALQAWRRKLATADAIAFDTETDSLDPMRARLVGISLAVDPCSAAYIPLAHDYPGAPAQLDRAHVLDTLRPLLEDAQRSKIAQNAKYDMHVLARHGITLRG